MLRCRHGKGAPQNRRAGCYRPRRHRYLWGDPAHVLAPRSRRYLCRSGHRLTALTARIAGFTVFIDRFVRRGVRSPSLRIVKRLCKRRQRCRDWALMAAIGRIRNIRLKNCKDFRVCPTPQDGFARLSPLMAPSLNGRGPTKRKSDDVTAARKDVAESGSRHRRNVRYRPHRHRACAYRNAGTGALAASCPLDFT
jgi:hypothetical protein